MPASSVKHALWAAALVSLPAVAQTTPGANNTAPRPKFESFEVASIKPVDPEARAGRYIRMQSAHQFLVRNYTVHGMIGSAWNLTDRAISGGPEWAQSDRFEILAVTPGDVQPNLDEQMTMLRRLLTDRFHLAFHRESKEFSVYALTVAKGGPKLAQSSGPPEAQQQLINTVFPELDGGFRIGLPARNATMAQFTSMLQRGVLDRPVIDRTGLAGRYDFQLNWKPDPTQFEGKFGPSPASEYPDFYTALQQQLGLRMESTRAAIDVLVIDRVEHPTGN